MIVPLWPSWFREQFGGELPSTYCTLDTETTGFMADKDVIVEIGHCLVEDGKVVSELDLVLNWIGHPVVSGLWLRDRLDFTRSEMLRQGRKYKMSLERMKAEGIQPEKALQFYHELTASLAERGVPFVLHNAFFDENMLAHNFAGFRIDPDGFQFESNKIWCTMAMEKANQCVDKPDAMPMEGETLREYFRRIKNIGGSKVKASLDEHCVKKYKLEDKYGLDPREAHNALYDARVTHCLFEEFRKQSAGVRGFRVPQPGAEFYNAKLGESHLSPPELDPFSGQPYAGVPARKSAVRVPTPPAPQSVRRRGQRNR